jgi:eukaryotic-like serine/threonine-protein kinase
LAAQRVASSDHFVYIEDPVTSPTERVGRYQLLEPIGVGPCGTVSRAKVFGVAGFERQFAVKRFHTELTATTALAQALSAAARAYGSLEHPRIARMSEFGVAQGTTFTAVELVVGLDTMRLIAEARANDATLAAGGALALVSQAARAVGYAHGRGLSHLGLSPTNVIVNAEGDIKITDFGILSATLPARPVDVPRLANRVPYLAPEQLANEGTSAATDVFALGVLAYELVTGQRTFRGDTPQQIAQSVMGGPPAEPPLPRPIVRVLQRCLARSPFERFPDARALADALDAAIRVAPVPGTRKDIGAMVKTTLDRLAAQNEGMLSGMLPLDIGTAAPAGAARLPAVGLLGRESLGDPSTQEFVRPDTPVPGPTPLIGPGALLARATAVGSESAPPATTIPDMPKQPMTTVTGVAPPPIPVPQGIAQPPSVPPPAGPNAPTTLLGVPGVPKPQTMAGAPPPARPSPPLIANDAQGTAPPPIPPPRKTPPPIPSVIPRKTPPSIPIVRPPTPQPIVPNETSGPMSEDTATVRLSDAAANAALVPSLRASSQPRPPASQDALDAETRPLFDAIHDGVVSRPEPSEEIPRIPIENLASGPTSPLSDEDVSPFEAETVRRDATNEAPTVSAMPPIAGGGPPFSPPAEQALPPLPYPTPPPGSAFTPHSAAGVSIPTPSALEAGGSERAKATLGVRQQKNPPWLWAIAGILVAIALGLGGWLAYMRLGKGSEAANSGGGSSGSAVAMRGDAGGVQPPPPIADAAGSATVARDGDAANPPPAPDAAPAPSPDLAITSEPAGAKVFLDGAAVGTTPLKLPGTPDRHTIGLLLAGHELYVAQVDGHGAFAIPLKDVTPTGGPAGIKVRCTTKERFYVFVDGKPTGQTCPTERIETELGAHTVEVYDLVSETRRKWEINITDTRLSYRVKVDEGPPPKKDKDPAPAP